MRPQFYNTKVASEIADKQVFQCHLKGVGSVDSASLYEQVAKASGMPVAQVAAIASALTRVVIDNGMNGLRTTIEGLCRFEIVGKGTFDSIDEQWNPEKHSLQLAAVVYGDVRDAAKDVIPENVEKPTQIQVLGLQDQTTFEQNVIHNISGRITMIQGKNLRINMDPEGGAVEGEGVFVRYPDGNEIPLVVEDSTAGTIDCVVGAPLTAAEGCTIVVRGRDGKSGDYMVVEGTLSGIKVVED